MLIISHLLFVYSNMYAIFLILLSKKLCFCAEMEETDNKENKLRQKRLTVEERGEIIKDFNNGMKIKALQEKYQVHRTTLSKIIKRKGEILTQMQILKEMNVNGSKIKKVTKVHDSRFEKSVLTWFNQRRSLNEPVTGDILREKARQIHEKLHGPSRFTASDGWLQKFQKRHNIRSLSMKGEKNDAQTEDADNFCIAFSQLLQEQGYDLDNVYNADETALFWKSLPRRTLAADHEKEASGGKILKDRVTVHVCANATGTHKIPLLLIGRYQNPRWMKNMQTMPLVYKAQKKSWMDKKLFSEWYTTVFLPSIKDRKSDSNEKFILILDNAPGHPSAEDLNKIDPQCFVLYLPPNVTSLIQPMDQGVISSLKRRYKASFLRELYTEEHAEKQFIVNFMKNWKLNQCIFLLAASWNEVTASTLKNGWKQVLSHYHNAQSEYTSSELSREPTIDCAMLLELTNRLPGQEICSLEEIEHWVEQDRFFPPWEPLTVEAIIKSSGLEPSNAENDHVEEESFQVNPCEESSIDYSEEFIPPSLNVVLNCIGQLCYCGEHGAYVTPEEYFILRKMKSRLQDSHFICDNEKIEESENVDQI